MQFVCIEGIRCINFGCGHITLITKQQSTEQAALLERSNTMKFRLEQPKTKYTTEIALQQNDNWQHPQNNIIKRQQCHKTTSKKYIKRCQWCNDHTAETMTQTRIPK